ncbi:MAG: SHOCT domain-containing protein [Clostridia bacterium]|nr:SHOCT domain-containing protein [Clostridia bacterium]
MFIWYRNSILATALSLMGCASILAAVSELIKDESLRELTTPQAVVAIAVGVALAVLGKVISVRKASRKNTAVTASASAPAAAHPAPVQSAPAAVTQTPVKGLTAAGIFALLTIVLTVGATLLAGRNMLTRATDIVSTIEIGLYVLLAAGCFRAKSLRAASGLQAVCFFGLCGIEALSALTNYRVYGPDHFIASDGAIYHYMYAAPALAAAAFLLMAVFALCACAKTRSRAGGFARALWFLPTLLLIVSFTKLIGDSHIPGLLEMMFSRGVISFRPEFLVLLSVISTVLTVFFAGLGLRRLCGLSAPSAPAPRRAAYVYEPVSSNPVPPAQPVQPQPIHMQPAQPVQPKPAAPQADPQDIDRKLQAYKDLLDCGILSQAEYDQKVRELTRG